MRMRRLSRSRRGEIAVFDVVLFMPLMLVALLFLQSALAVHVSPVQEITNGSRYAAQGLNTFLTATVPLTKALSRTGAAESMQDYSVRSLLLWDVYLVSCQTATQAALDMPGWMGWSINQTASTIAGGTTEGGSPQSFTHYYIEFNGTAPASRYCAGTPIPVHTTMGQRPVLGSVDDYTSVNVLIPPALPGEGGVQVVMGVWQQA